MVVNYVGIQRNIRYPQGTIWFRTFQFCGWHQASVNELGSSSLVRWASCRFQLPTSPMSTRIFHLYRQLQSRFLPPQHRLCSVALHCHPDKIQNPLDWHSWLYTWLWQLLCLDLIVCLETQRIVIVMSSDSKTT